MTAKQRWATGLLLVGCFSLTQSLRGQRNAADFCTPRPGESQLFQISVINPQTGQPLIKMKGIGETLEPRELNGRSVVPQRVTMSLPPGAPAGALLERGSLVMRGEADSEPGPRLDGPALPALPIPRIFARPAVFPFSGFPLGSPGFPWWDIIRYSLIWDGNWE